MTNDIVEITVRLEPEMLRALRSIRNDQVDSLESRWNDSRVTEELQSENNDEILMDLIIQKYRSKIKHKTRDKYRTGPIGCDRRSPPE